MRFSVVVGLLAVFAASGCERFETVSECNHLAQTVNPAISELTQLRQAERKSVQPASYEKLAAHYDALAQKLQATHFSDKRIADDVKSYAEVIAQAGTLSRQFGAALTLADIAAQQRLSGALLALKTNEEQQVAKLQARCSEH